MGHHYRVTVSSKRQMTLPAELCAELGIERGTMLDITTDESGAIVLRPRRSITDLVGSWSRILGETPAPTSRDDAREIGDQDAVDRDERSRARSGG